MLLFVFLFERQGQSDANEAGLTGLGRDDFEFSVMGLDDFAADGEAEAEADIARGVEGGGRLLPGFGAEARTVVLDFNLHIVSGPRRFYPRERERRSWGRPGWPEGR